jgi:hypothetical protein
VEQAATALSTAGYTVAVLNHFSSGAISEPVVGTLRRNPLLYFLKLRGARARVVHYHHAGRVSLLVAVAIARHDRSSQWLVTLHNHSLTKHLESSVLARALLRWALGRFNQIVAVSPEIAETLRRHGVVTPITVLPAYIGTVPTASSSDNDWSPREFFDRPGPTLVLSAYRVSRHGSSTDDVYGLDIASGVFDSLASKHPDLKLAVFLAHKPRGRWAKRYAECHLAGIENAWPGRVLVVTGERLTPAFCHDVIYLRPTRTDGDAVSVREALTDGIAVLASDVASRPHGSRVLALNDHAAWTKNIEELLGGKVDGDGDESVTLSRSTNLLPILDLYECYLKLADYGGTAVGSE